MNNINLFVFFNFLFICKSEFEEPLITGIKSYHRNENEYSYFKFYAIDNGAYAIIFPNSAHIIEIKGNLEISRQSSSIMFTDEFENGDYIKVQYPDFDVYKEEDFKVRIEKINAKVMMITELEAMFTKDFSNCKNSLLAIKQIIYLLMKMNY